MSDLIRDMAIRKANWYLRNGIEHMDKVACPSYFAQVVTDAYTMVTKRKQESELVKFIERIGELLGLEWPHLVPPDRISFCASVEDACRVKRSNTSVGSYLARILPELTGAEIELLVAKTRDANHVELKFLTDSALVEQMYNCNAHSCMCPCGGEWRNHKLHPYNVYSSRLGWAMAVKLDKKGQAQSRSIVRPEEKTFIRIYGARPSGEHGNIGDDPVLRDWLLGQDFRTVGGWDGKKIERIIHKGKVHANSACYLGPYIDGGIKKCRLPKDDPSSMLVCSEGNYCLENTAGFAYCLFEDHEGMVKLYNGVWVQPEDAIAGDGNRLLPRETAVFVERRHNWFPPEEIMVIEGKPERAKDCINAETPDGKGYYILVDDAAMVYLLNERTVLAHSKDCLLDYKEIRRFAAQCTLMTAGAFTGKFALTRKCCTRNKDGSIMLRGNCQQPYTVSQEQWEPENGDRVRLNKGIYKDGDPRNPTDCDGTILSLSGIYHNVAWANGQFNCYATSLPWECFRLVALAKDNPDAERLLNAPVPFIIGPGARVMLSARAFDWYRKSSNNPENVPGTVTGRVVGKWWAVKWDNGTENVYEFDECFLSAPKFVPASKEKDVTHA